MGRLYYKNGKVLLGKKGRTDPKKWEGLTRKMRNTDLEKWEGLTGKNGKV